MLTALAFIMFEKDINSSLLSATTSCCESSVMWSWSKQKGPIVGSCSSVFVCTLALKSPAMYTGPFLLASSIMFINGL